jgi:hypothetical protein
MTAKFDFNTLKTGLEADWPVTVGVPQDGGTVAKQEFTARFKTLTKDEDKAAQEDGDPDAWINAFWLGAGKTEAPIDAETRKLMLERSYVRQGIVAAYIQFSQGVAAKN